jgi:hypothetical protein
MVSRWLSQWRPGSKGGPDGPVAGPVRQTHALRSVRRVLVLAPDDPGLLLLTTPALRHVRRSLPQARIDLIGGKGVEMLVGTGLVDRLQVNPSPSRGGFPWSWRRKPDLLLDFRDRPSAERPRARHQAVLAPRPDNALVHEIRRRIGLLEGLLPPPAGAPDIEMGFASAEESWAVQRLQRGADDDASLSLLMHATPDWPAECWTALARAVCEVPHTRLFLSGIPVRLPGIGRCEALGAVPNSLALAAFVGRVDLLICGASLPMHMVGATETPAVLLLTADDAPRLVPLAGDPMLAVAPAAMPLSAVPVERVAEAVRNSLVKALDRQQRRSVSQRRAKPPEPRTLMRRPDDAPKR